MNDATKMNIHIEELVWEKHRENVLNIEHNCFDCDSESDTSDFKKILSNGFGYMIFAGKEAIGYLTALPLEKAHYSGCIQDSHFGKNDTIYVESEAIKPHTNTTAFLAAARYLKKEIKERGFNRITLHTKSDSKLNTILKNIGAQEISKHTNFMNFGYNSTYLSLEI